MPTARLSSSKAFMLLLIALLQLAWAPAGGACSMEDAASEACCVELESAPPPATTCCDEPDVPPPPPDDPVCPCATQPGPGPVPAKAALLSGSFHCLEPRAAPLTLRRTTSRELRAPALPPAGLGPPVYRLHCALLI